MAPVSIDTHNFLVKAYNRAVENAKYYDTAIQPAVDSGIPSGYNKKFCNFVRDFYESLGHKTNDQDFQYLRETESCDFFDRCNYKFFKLNLDMPLDNENDKYKFYVEFINWAGEVNDRVRLYNNEQCTPFFVIHPRYEHM